MIRQFLAAGIPTDASGFEQFFYSHQPRLFRIELGLLRDTNDAPFFCSGSIDLSRAILGRTMLLRCETEARRKAPRAGT